MKEDKVFEIYYLLEKKKESKSELDQKCVHELEGLLELASLYYFYYQIQRNSIDFVLRAYLPPSKQLLKRNNEDDDLWEEKKLTVRDKLYIEFAWNAFCKCMKNEFDYTEKKMRRIFFKEVVDYLIQEYILQNLCEKVGSSPYRPYYLFITSLPKEDYYAVLTALPKWMKQDIYADEADDEDEVNDEDETDSGKKTTRKRKHQYRLDKLHIDTLHSAMNELEKMFSSSFLTRRECFTSLFTENFLEILISNLRSSVNGDEKATVNIFFLTAYIRGYLSYDIRNIKNRKKTGPILRITTNVDYISLKEYIKNLKTMMDDYFELKNKLDQIVESI